MRPCDPPPTYLPRALLRRRFAALWFLGALLALTQGCSGKKLGDSCDLSDDGACGDEMECLQGADFSTPVCTAECTSDKSCKDGGHCVELSTGSFCLPECKEDKDCNDSSLCTAPTLSTASFKVCLSESRAIAAPSITCPAPTLVTGGVAGPPAEPTECRRTPQTSTLGAGRATILGVFGPSQTAEFDVPANTDAMSLVIQQVSGAAELTYQGSPVPNYILPMSLIDPTGATIYDLSADTADDLTQEPIAFNSFAPNTVVIGLPNTSAALTSVDKANGLEAGKWRLMIYDLATDCPNDSSCVNSSGAGPSTFNVTLITQPTAPKPGALDLGVYFATQETITAATAVANPSIARMLSTWGSYYASAGICLRTVTFYDLPAWAKTKYASNINVDESGACSDLNQMFTLSQPGNTLNIFLVDALKSEGNGEQVVAGIDGTIPGPSSIAGTPQSGAAVTMANLFQGQCSGAPNLRTCGADEVAYIAAHEAGHWLGLYHTSESIGTVFDPLVDSSACRCASCVSASRALECVSANSADSPTVITAADCNKSTVLCGGADNLMFWLLDDAVSTGKLTDEQGKVMRSNPAVQVQ